MNISHISKDMPSFEEHREAVKAELKAITERLEQGVQEVFASERYQSFLDTMAKFPHYSMNNSLLILMQKPDASLVQSYNGWKEMGRYVKKGEKGFRILAPAPYKIKVEQDKTDAWGKPVIGADGQPVKETVEEKRMAFKPVSTFDISQTEGEPLPTLGTEDLTGSVEGYQTLFEALKAACPVPVAFENIESGAKGYFDVKQERIAIQEGMSEVQNVKTLIHEMTHQKLHSIDKETGERPDISRNQKEVEAESTAYTVCKHFGIDTSDYSFSYVAGWSQGREMEELKGSLETIRRASAQIINSVEGKLYEITEEKEQAAAEKAEEVPEVFVAGPAPELANAARAEGGIAQMPAGGDELDAMLSDLQKEQHSILGKLKVKREEAAIAPAAPLKTKAFEEAL